METSPHKRRRSASPLPPSRPSLSPTRPVLPPPTPSSHAPGGPSAYPRFQPPSSAGGPSSWQAPWASPAQPRESELAEGRERDREVLMERSRDRDRVVRRSLDARSPPPELLASPRMENIEEGSEGGSSAAYAREPTGRAPRSMMACTRCRKQKYVVHTLLCLDTH